MLTKVDDISRYGKVEFVPDTMQITGFYEKQDVKGEGWINAGVYLLNPALIQDFPDTKFSLEKQVFPELLHKKIYASCSKGKFIDIGTPESYETAQEYLKEASSY